MIDLSKIAYEERMIPNAPILATHAIEINAPVERVWQVARDVKNWPQWDDHLKNAKIDGPFVQGSHFSFGGLFKHHLTLSKIRQFDLVMYFGSLLGYSGVTKWKFTRITSEKTEVTFTESSKGFLISLLYSNVALKTHLKTWLEKLKERAELN